MMKRSKAIEERKNQAIEQKSALLKNAETVDTLKIQPLEYHTNMLMSFSDVSVIYDGRQVCKPVTFELSGLLSMGKMEAVRVVCLNYCQIIR